MPLRLPGALVILFLALLVGSGQQRALSAPRSVMSPYPTVTGG
jgi:hypothetical protein